MRIKIVIASAIVAATGFAIAPTAAFAALSDCATGSMCLWGNNDFKYGIATRTAGSSTITNLSSAANDDMDSWANQSSTYAGCMWSDANGSGDRQTLSRNSNDNNVSPANSDEVSSWRTAYAC
jgi:hypothetical protein